jgi:hypothetical protein
VDPARRRSPQWVRDMEDRELHAVAFRLQHERMQAGLTDAQEWLFDALVSELEFRRRRATWPSRKCSCELCIGPFEFDLPPESSTLGGSDVVDLEARDERWDL